MNFRNQPFNTIADKYYLSYKTTLKNNYHHKNVHSGIDHAFKIVCLCSSVSLITIRQWSAKEEWVSKMNKHFILPDTPPDSSLIYFIWARSFCVDRCELSVLHHSSLTSMSHWLLGIILFFSCSQKLAISTCKTKAFHPCYITDLIASMITLFL